MHLVRSGSGRRRAGSAWIADHIGYAQLNDTTLQPRIDNYMEEAMFERMVPGEGELPLHDILVRASRRHRARTRSSAEVIGIGRVSPTDRLRPVCRGGPQLLAESR